MKIAIIQPRTAYHVAGSEKVSVRHSIHLALRGHTVTLYTSHPPAATYSSMYLNFKARRPANVALREVELPVRFAGWREGVVIGDHEVWLTESLAFNEAIYEEVKASSPDLILSYYLPDAIFKPSGISNVVYLSGYPQEPIESYRSFFRFVDGVILIGSHLRQYWGDQLDRVPLQYVLGTGVDYPCAPVVTINSPSRLNIVFAGRLIERKGLRTLLRALAAVLESEPSVLLWVLGDGPQAGEIEAEVLLLGLQSSVVLVGRVDNPEDYFRMGDVCVFPSHRGDGLMGVVLEAMSVGAAVVSTYGNGNESVIRNNVNGLLVEAENVSALAAALVSLLRNSRRRGEMGACAEETVRRSLRWELNVQYLERILLEVIASRTAGEGCLAFRRMEGSI